MDMGAARKKTEREFTRAPVAHGAPDAAGGDAPDAFYRLIYIVNIDYLTEAYGSAFAQAIEYQVKRRLTHMAMPELDHVAVDMHEDCLSLQATLISGSQMDGRLFDETVVMLLSSRPFVVGGQAVIAEVAIRQIHPDARFLSRANADESIRRLSVAPVRHYVRDMATSVEVYWAIEQEKLVLHTQSIWAVDASRVLYHECLARLGNAGGASAIMPDAFIPALEKTRFIRHFDRYVVRKAIELLRQDDTLCLGCNISAISATSDAWWSSTFKLLAMAPHVATRLVIELTETAECLDMEETRQFCARLRTLGCRIAVDDFGSGYGSIDFALSIRPDVVKIDMAVMRSLRSSSDMPTLRHMVQMLDGLSAQIVAEGIETEADYEAARSAGIAWLQGRYLDPAPSQIADIAIRQGNIDALIEQLSSIEIMEPAGVMLCEKLAEYTDHARQMIESPAYGLSASEAAAAVERYSDTLYRGLCALPESLGKSGKNKFPAKLHLSDDLKCAMETIGAAHGAALRAQWKKKRSPAND